MEEKTIDITSDEEIPTISAGITKDEIEVLVDQSGIKMWQPKTWRDWVTEHKKTCIAFGVLSILFLGTFVTSLNLVLSNEKLEKSYTTLKSSNRQLTTDVSDAEDAQRSAESKTYDCQVALKTAWGAWDRRNGVMIKMLENLFSSDTSIVTDDNTTAAIEFRSAVDTCNPGMDPNEIFTDY